MKKITFLFLILPFLAFGQQDNPGKVFELVDARQAMVGDFQSFEIFDPQIRNASDSYSNGVETGDMDVLSASWFDDKIAWYENDGDGNFGAQQIITTNADGAHSVYSTDLDGDGDMDVLSASPSDDKIAWYENDGDGNFAAQEIITTNAFAAFSVYATDLDGDGDMDVLSASFDDNKIAWYENDGDGNFGAQQIITTNANGAFSVYATDLDGDGDMDVLSASWIDDKIAWYENDGDGDFHSQQIITTNADGAYSVYSTDLDGDGDMDVLSASGGDNKIAWYKNLHPLGVNENKLLDFSVFPNPTNDFTTISIDTEATYTLVSVNGQILQQGKLSNGDNKVNLSHLSTGLYFINIKTDIGSKTLKLIMQ